MKDNLLPIGTVIGAKETKNMFLIVGFYGTDATDNNKLYDYICYTYPEGFMTKDEIFLLNIEDVDRVYYMGYKSEEHEKFEKEIKTYIENDSKEGL